MSDDASMFELVINAPAAFDAELARSNRKILMDAYLAVLDGDHDAVFQCCAEDVVFYEPPSLPYGCIKHGVDGAREGVAGAFGAWASLRCEIEEFVATADIVIAYMHVTTTSVATGGEYEGPTAEMFRLRDGKIVEWRVIYWDAHRVREACGLD